MPSDRVSPLAVPVLVMIGRESLPAGAADDALLFEAEALAAAAMGEGQGGVIVEEQAPGD